VSRETDILEQQIAENLQQQTYLRESERALERRITMDKMHLARLVSRQNNPHITNAEGE
jgi:hypothetical protein